MKTPPAGDFPGKLRILRAFRDLSQEDLAARTADESGKAVCAASYISRLEKGLSQPSAEVARRLAIGLEVEVHVLLDPAISVDEALRLARSVTSSAVLPTRKEVPGEIFDLPDEVLDAIARAIRERGRDEITFTVYPDQGDGWSVVMREQKVVYDNVEKRRSTRGGKRGSGAA